MENNEPFVVFTCRINMQKLCECELILADGTFIHCQKFFKHIKTIHGYLNGHYVPLVRALLSNQTEALYGEFFKCLKFYCANSGLLLEPLRILTDFEVSS
jgi:hypothetical protein